EYQESALGRGRPLPISFPRHSIATVTRRSSKMRISPILATSVLAISLGAASFGAHAADPDGFYVGAGAGQSIIDEDFADDEDTAFQVFAGYQFNRYFGAEAAYTDF